MIKKLISLILIICLVTPLLVSCHKDQDDGDDVLRDFVVSTDHIDAFTYLAHRTELDYIRLFDRVSAQVHNGRIYYGYTEFLEYDSTNDENDESDGSNVDINKVFSTLIVASITVNGEDFRQIELAGSKDLSIINFNVSDDGTFVILAVLPVLTTTSVSYTLVRGEYDFNGRELNRDEFTDQLSGVTNFQDMMQAVIPDNDHIVLLIHGERSNSLKILNTDTGSVAELQLRAQHRNNHSMLLLEDGRLLVLDAHKDADTGGTSVVLREIDIDTEDFGEEYPIDGSISSNILPVRDSMPYDFLIVNNSYLYGYSIKTGEQMRLLSWSGIGIAGTHGMTDAYVGAYSDGSLFVMLRTWFSGTGEIMLYILSQVSRDEMPEQVVIILGGVMISDYMRSAVIDFNLENRFYKIEIIDYFELVGGSLQGVNTPALRQAAFDRFRTDMITGKGPDIIIDSLDFSASGHFLDLYPFIDADIELDRTDILPTVLKSLELSDGTLPGIVTTFSINTMIGTRETVGHIDSWTPSAMLTLAEESNLEYPFDTPMLRWSFIWNQLWTGAEFIDWENFKANIDSDAFISMLESSKFIPENREPGLRYLTLETYFKLLRGESLILWEAFSTINDYRFVADLIGEDMIILGQPTADGGKHFLTIGQPIGINAAAQNAGGAWEFLRTLLLNVVSYTDYYGDIYYNFPVHIGLFEELILDATTPRYAKNTDGSIQIDDDGNPVEIPHFIKRTSADALPDGAGFGVLDIETEIYTMSDFATAQLCNIVYNSTPFKSRFSETLTEMLYNDIDMYVEGARTAEDTARLMQNRVQRYLSEQELISGGR